MKYLLLFFSFSLFSLAQVTFVGKNPKGVPCVLVIDSSEGRGHVEFEDAKFEFVSLQTLDQSIISKDHNQGNFEFSRTFHVNAMEDHTYQAVSPLEKKFTHTLYLKKKENTLLLTLIRYSDKKTINQECRFDAAKELNTGLHKDGKSGHQSERNKGKDIPMDSHPERTLDEITGTKR